MESIVKFVSPKRVTVQTSQGDRFTLGLSEVVPFEFQQQEAEVIAKLFDIYYKGDPSVIMGPILRGMCQYGCFGSIYWYGPDRDQERERIGAQIRSLREQRRFDAKELAQLADLDASNLCRIEKGKYSPGLDILVKIATALDCTIEFVPASHRIDFGVHAYPEKNKTWLITAKRDTFLLAECLAKYGGYHWQQGRYNVSLGDTIYIYLSEERRIAYRMEVESINEPYDKWMAKEEEFWVDKNRINESEVGKKYAYLELIDSSDSDKMSEDNLAKHGFLRAPLGTKELEGDLLKYIERHF